MHPRNPHKDRYDFPALIKSFPELGSYVIPSRAGDQTIEFDNPIAVKALNRAILSLNYGIKHWDLPAGFLCPPIPGRADYLHYLADLFPNPKNLKGLDVGVGANCIYPLLGHKAYGWSFVGTDIDSEALKNAGSIVKQNELQDFIELRLQTQRFKIFEGVISPADRFDFSLCNPPFHASADEARAGTDRKRKNLGLKEKGKLNFGGMSQELWCEGGERAFISQMIMESSQIPQSVKWFTSLVSKEENIPMLQKKLKEFKCKEMKIIDMVHGNKKSRILGWSFA